MNKPYEGTLVPEAFRGKDSRVESVMIEVNRSLYMDEGTGKKRSSFGNVKRVLGRLLGLLDHYQHGDVQGADKQNPSE